MWTNPWFPVHDLMMVLPSLVLALLFGIQKHPKTMTHDLHFGCFFHGGSHILPSCAVPSVGSQRCRWPPIQGRTALHKHASRCGTTNHPLVVGAVHSAHGQGLLVFQVAKAYDVTLPGKFRGNKKRNISDIYMYIYINKCAIYTYMYR